MTTHLYQPFQPLASDGGALIRVLLAAGVEKTDLIRVVGPSGPIATLWLNAHGYDRAVFVRAPIAPRGLPADALLVAHPCGADELDSLVGPAEGVRDGGAVIVQARAGRQGEDLEAVAGWLRRSGFAAQRRLNDKGRSICIARRADAPIVNQAA